MRPTQSLKQLLIQKKYKKVPKGHNKTRVIFPLLPNLDVYMNATYINRLSNAAKLFAAEVPGYEVPHSLEKMVEIFGENVTALEDSSPVQKSKIYLNEFQSSAILNAIFRQLIECGLLSEDDDKLPGIQDDVVSGEGVDLIGDNAWDKWEIDKIIDEYDKAYPENKFPRSILPKEKVSGIDEIDYYHTRTIPREYIDGVADSLRSIAQSDAGKTLHDKLASAGMKTSVTLSWLDEY